MAYDAKDDQMACSTVVSCHMNREQFRSDIKSLNPGMPRPGDKISKHSREGLSVSA